MRVNNYQLIVAGMSNDIYLGTLKKNSPFPVMNEKRRIMTDEAIRAVATHMMSLPEGQGYEFKGKGTLLWVPEGTVLKKQKEELQ
jgi:hypothetical protein